MPESKAAKTARTEKVLDLLAKQMPDVRSALVYDDALQLLVAVILSAQCTDAVVNQVTPALFAKCKRAADYVQLGANGIEPFIKRVGLFHTKAKNIAAAMRTLEEQHGGGVPRDRQALEALPGVGRKTAGVVLSNAFDIPALPVDTHVGRVARRLGLSRNTNPDKVEADLCALIPPERWGKAHHLLIWHGRRTCDARAPKCAVCVVTELCPKRGV